METIEIKPYTLPDFKVMLSEEPFAYTLWRPDKICVVMGQSNRTETSLHASELLNSNTEVYKRPSGGESVILTPETLVIALAFKYRILKNPGVYFRVINGQLINALNSLGIENAVSKGISDISIGERKILGSSIYRSIHKVFYHAVLNVSESAQMMENFLKHPQKEPEYRQGRPHSHFVTSLYAEGYKIPFSELISAISATLPSCNILLEE